MAEYGLSFVRFGEEKLVGNPVKIPVEGDLVISGYCDSHDAKSLKIVTGGKEFVVGNHVASPDVSFHHSPKIAGARLCYISQRQHETKDAFVFKFHWEVADEENSPVIPADPPRTERFVHAGYQVGCIFRPRKAERVFPLEERVFSFEEPLAIPLEKSQVIPLVKMQAIPLEKAQAIPFVEHQAIPLVEGAVVTTKDVKELVNKVRAEAMDKQEADQWLAQISNDGTHHHYDLVDRVDWAEVSGWRDSGFIHVLENLHLGKVLLKWHAAESKEKIDAEEEVRRCISKGGVTAYITHDEEENKETFTQAKDAWNELCSPKCKLLLSALFNQLF